MNDDLLIILIGSSAMVLLVGSLLTFTFLYQRKMNRRKKELQEIKELLNSEELNAAYALLEGQDKERRRIANDLHDSMGGKLATAKIYLDLLENSDLSSKQKEHVLNIQRVTSNVITGIRDVAHDLSNSTLMHYGLQKALEQLFDAIRESKKIRIDCHMSIELEIETRLMRDIYNIIQELVTNTLRHAKARNIYLELNAHDDTLSLIYEDDGIGINTNGYSPGLGLKSIQTRCERYDGLLTIDAESKNGASFIIEIPIEHETED